MTGGSSWGAQEVWESLPGACGDLGCARACRRGRRVEVGMHPTSVPVSAGVSLRIRTRISTSSTGWIRRVGRGSGAPGAWERRHIGHAAEPNQKPPLRGRKALALAGRGRSGASHRCWAGGRLSDWENANILRFGGCSRPRNGLPSQTVMDLCRSEQEAIMWQVRVATPVLLGLMAVAGVFFGNDRIVHGATATAGRPGAMESVADSHFTHWVHWRAPFTGYWDRFGVAHPSSHPTPWGGDWSVDYYSAPGTPGSFYASSSAGYSVYGIVSAVSGSCSNRLVWAGYMYRVDVHDTGLGYRGWVLYAHVQDTYGATWYRLQPGQQVTNGSGIGWTERWSYSSCYQATNDAGVHWHLEAYQPTHYACWYPYQSGTGLAQGAVLGAVGSNAVRAKAPCW